MATQPALTFDPGIPFEILDSQPSPKATERRMAEAHELCEAFREDNRRHLVVENNQATPRGYL